MKPELAYATGALRNEARADGGGSAASSAARSLILPLLGALGVCALLGFSAGPSPVPALPVTLLFLFAAVFEDLRRRKIPNWLNGAGLAGALGYAAWSGGLPGFGASLLGAALAFGLLFGTYFVGWLGAGDVKATMVLGALWKIPVLLAGLFWMFSIGGAFALLWLTWRGGLTDLLARWWMSFWLSVTTRRPTYLAAAPGAPARSGLPFAVCMGLGAAAFQFWGAPW